jgi:hypothetical protein
VAVKMVRTTGLDNIFSRNGLMLLAVALLPGSLGASLNSAYPGLQLPVLAGLVFAGSFIVSMAVIAGIKIVKMR